jgi:DNA-damage-inducible protein J
VAQATLSVSVDESDKQQFELLCSDAGMNASDAINLFVKAVIRERRIPFEITASNDPFYSPANQAHLKRSLDQLNAGKGVVHELIEVDDD